MREWETKPKQIPNKTKASLFHFTNTCCNKKDAPVFISVFVYNIQHGYNHLLTQEKASFSPRTKR